MSDEVMQVITAKLISKCHNRLAGDINLEQVAHELGTKPEEISDTYNIALAESLQTLSLLENLEFKPGARILEVGAGYGLASICLAMMGFDVTALEPGGLSFEQNKAASILFASTCGVSINHIAESVEFVDFSRYEKFDLIISNNVLEHIPDFDIALTNLNNALNNDGVMVHSCANYLFPFEPHFGLPLVPFIPQLTRFLIPKSISKSGLWNSLNFIKMSQVNSNSKRNGMICSFKTGTMGKSIQRLHRDEQFAARHTTIARLVKNRFLYRALLFVTKLPVRVATPMDFLVCFPSHSESKNVKTWRS